MQIAAVAIVANVFPQTRGLIFHVPNGGSRNYREAANLKKMGVVAGVPDIIFIWKRAVHAFEFKSEDGNLSDKQKEIHELWAEQGVSVTIIRKQADFVTAIRDIIQPK